MTDSTPSATVAAVPFDHCDGCGPGTLAAVIWETEAAHMLHFCAHCSRLQQDALTSQGFTIAHTKPGTWP